MKCAACGHENAESNRFCGGCGRALPEPVVSSPTDEVFQCKRHRKETTRVTCGRCGTSICHRCMVVGANGVRCKDCARNKIPVRLSGVLHDAGRGVKGATQSMGARPVWYLYLWSLLIRLIMGFFGR